MNNQVGEEIKEAVRILKKGGVILYPTDTIWGIGCDATNEEAVRKVSRIKKRPLGKNFIMLVDSKDMLLRYAKNVAPDVILEMEHATLPTTFILPGVNGIAPSLIHNDGTTGIRIPKDIFCTRLIRESGVPLVSTSANYFSQHPPASFRFIDPGLIKEVDYVVKWRQEESTPAKPSHIIRIYPDGTRAILRD